jgi:hypothetical protein
MNKNKTGGIWVGKLKHSKDKIEGIKWYEKPFKTLGVYFKPPISKLPIIVFLLTLSGLPSHMNLKHLLSIPFLYLSGTTYHINTLDNLVRIG